MDVWAQWRFLEPMAFTVPDPRNPGQQKPMPFGQFQERYGVFGGWQGRQIVGFQNLGEMQEVMARNSIVVRKEDALDLPETVDVKVPEIGRTSCRERVCQYVSFSVVAVSLKKKHKTHKNRTTK